MTIYFAGTSIADLSGNSGLTSTTSATNASTAVCREGVVLQNGPVFGSVDFPSALSLFYFSFRMRPNAFPGASTAQTIVEFFDTSVSATQGLFRIRKTDTWSVANSLSVDYWNGSSWTSIGTFTPADAITNMTFHIDIADSGGTFEAWYGNSAVGTPLTGDTKLTTSTTINMVRFSTTGTSTGWTLSEWVCASVDTRDFRVAALSPTGNGTNTAWTNDYTAVDETGITETDYISGASNGDLETYTMSDIDSSVSTADVQALVVAMRARKGGSGPQNLQAALRISGTDYASSSVTNLTTAFGPTVAVFNTNPATSSNWTQSAVNGAEIGVKAIT